LPDRLRHRSREDLKQSLGDESELDVAMVSADLPTGGIAVRIRFSMEVLVAADTSQWLHGAHPEVIGIRADDAKRLLEGHFDLASQPVDSDDVQGRQIQIRTHQQDGTTTRIVHRHEPDEDTDGSPQEVGCPEPDGHILLAVDGAGRLLKFLGILQQRGDLDLLAVLFGASSGFGLFAGDGVAGYQATLLLLTRVTRWFPLASSPRTILPVA